MASVGVSSQERLLKSVYVRAGILAGEGKKIKYTHLLDAFRIIYGNGTDKNFKDAFEKGRQVSNDLERAEALAELVEKVAQASNTDAEQQVKAVGHALRRWTSLGAETKGRIDQVFQNQVLQGKAKRWDRVKEFFRDLRASVFRSRLSEEDDKQYAKQVCDIMEERLLNGVEFSTIKFPKAENLTQKAFLKSAKELYKQRFLSVAEEKVAREEKHDIDFISALTVKARNYELTDVTQIDSGLRLLEDIRQKRLKNSQNTDDVEACISHLQLAKAAKYFDMFVANTSAEKTGNDTARAEARGNARAALMRLRDEVGADSPVGQDITKKLVEIAGMEEHETRLREQKKR